MTASSSIRRAAARSWRSTRSSRGVHFDGRLDAADVGWKSVAVNVSDVGAMGARPTWALLSLALPAPLDRAWVDGFAEACTQRSTTGRFAWWAGTPCAARVRWS
jgi:hypothetical protein